MVPLKVPVLKDDFEICQIFAQVFDKKSSQQCMIHCELATLGCILQYTVEWHSVVYHTLGNDDLAVYLIPYQTVNAKFFFFLNSVLF